MLRHVTLPIGLVGKLQATLVAHKRFDASVRSHVSIQKALPQIGLSAQLALERPRSHALVLPLVIEQITLGHKALLANVTLIWFLALVFDTNVLVDAGLVEHLLAHRTLGIQRTFLVGGQKVGLVFQPHMSR